MPSEAAERIVNDIRNIGLVSGQGTEYIEVMRMEVLFDALRQLDQWRHLPAYQLERRVDVLFGLMLPEVIESRFGASRSQLIPEFPLHKGETRISEDYGNNQSVNVDFALFCSNPEAERIFLVELKTDMHSIKKAQLCNMIKAKNANSESVLRGVIRAARASAESRKYAQLAWRLSEIGCITVDSTFSDMKMERRRPGLARNFRELRVSRRWSDVVIELILISPKHVDNINEYPFSEFHCIDFDEIAKDISGSRPPFGAEFAEYLRRWALTDAGAVSPWREGCN